MAKIMHLGKNFSANTTNIIDNLITPSATSALSANQGKVLNDKIEGIYGISDKWSSTKSYAIGNSVIYDNQVWSCILANDNQTPADGSLYWSRINLNNLGGMSFRVNDGKPEWKVAGADTWSPFSGGGCEFIGEYTSDTSIDISGYPEATTDSFIIETKGQGVGTYSNYSGYASYWTFYDSAIKTISGGKLNIKAPRTQVGQHGNRDGNIAIVPYRVWYNPSNNTSTSTRIKNNIVLSYNTQYVIDTGLTQINGFHIYTPRKVNSNWVLSVSYFGGSTQMLVAAADDGSTSASERTMPCTTFAGNLVPLINKIEGGKITLTGNTYNSNFDSVFYWEAW